MKLLYCFFDCSNFGGTERTLALQANYFAEHGHEVSIVTTEEPVLDKRAYPFSDKINFYNLDIRYAEVDGSYSPVKILRRLRKGRLHRIRLQSLVQQLNPDIIISLFSHEMPIVNKVKGDSVTVAQLHFFKYYRNVETRLLHKPLLLRWFVLLKEWRKRLYIGSYDAFVVLTEEDRSKWNLDNIHVIPNALPFQSEQVSALDSKHVISVGRLSVQKGYDQLLEAWHKVSLSHPDWILDIYGSGSEQERLEQLIRKYQLDNVVIHSPVSDIKTKYLESSIYVLSSLYEGFGLVLIEAMTCGVPCVSYACPCGPSDIIKDGVDGLLVPVGDTDALAEKLCMLIENPDLRKKMGKEAAKNVLRFSEENVMKLWENLFHDLLKNRK